MIIAVVGGDASSGPSPAALEQGEAVGAELARRGATLICGGRGGVMEAACRGASEAGGLTIGVLPGRDRADMNRYVQIPIVTGMSEARNAIIVLSADAVIAIDGEYGTLSEVALALANRKPVAGIGTWNLSKDGGDEPPIHRTTDAADAVRWAMDAVESLDRQIPPALKRRVGSAGTAPSTELQG
jgi:uncharacterized protein (TIGR00725 family)